MNRLACLRLAERCANLLLSMQIEVHETGNKVEKELAHFMEKLVECVLPPSPPCAWADTDGRSFTRMRDLLLKEAHRPIRKRYLKREDILREIAGCDTKLSDALSMFSVRR